MKMPRLPRDLQVMTVTPFSRGPQVHAMTAADVAKAAGIRPDDRDSLWSWCRQHAAIYVQFAPGKTWEDLAAEALEMGCVRIVVEIPPK